ncbi:hypothetical protein SUGI_0262210 [Cryptomeria japonica]|nr:hypothetical protein SUGI_0262210 [Cryptomeria japonica]
MTIISCYILCNISAILLVHYDLTSKPLDSEAFYSLFHHAGFTSHCLGSKGMWTFLHMGFSSTLVTWISSLGSTSIII